MPPATLSVTVPTYNERDSLPLLLTRLANPGVALDVVVVDDADAGDVDDADAGDVVNFPGLLVHLRLRRGPWNSARS
jgi:hypothetical protein